MNERDDPEILIVPLQGDLIGTLRRTFPTHPLETRDPTTRVRERVLRGAGMYLADVLLDHPSEDRHLALTLIAAEVAYVLGSLERCDGVLLVSRGEALHVADRLIAPGRREHIPDLPPVGRFSDIGASVGVIEDGTAWACMEWLTRRLAPHRVWVVRVPPHRKARERVERGESHRALRELLALFVEQCR